MRLKILEVKGNPIFKRVGVNGEVVIQEGGSAYPLTSPQRKDRNVLVASPGFLLKNATVPTATGDVDVSVGDVISVEYGQDSITTLKVMALHGIEGQSSASVSTVKASTT